MSELQANNSETLTIAESRDFRSYHAFLRSCRNFMDGPLSDQMREKYDSCMLNRPDPEGLEDVYPIIDDLTEFQLYSWCFRHLQRFKYHRPNFGIFESVSNDRERLVKLMDTEAEIAGNDLLLDASLKIPDYYKFVDFHQHTGGVYSDPLDGLFYEFGRRTTNPAHMDPNLIYRLSYSQFPDRPYDKVLDWGTGHGAGLIEWKKLHPESECYGVDLSGPCLKLANKRAREEGFRFKFSQQDIECLNFADNTFDCVFHLFMFHEIPPINLKKALGEVRRVLKPGGVFIGPEFGKGCNDLISEAIQKSHAWANNETYTPAWADFDIEKAAHDVGFKSVIVEPFAPLTSKKKNKSGAETSWHLFKFEK
jgi:SAM-dependent methyltransferase